jgi:glycerol 3-phosphatase-2
VPLSPLLASHDQVLIDLDGCVWVGEEITRGAPEAIAELRAAGKKLAFHTNNARHSTEDFVRKLWSLGIQASLEEVVTAGGAIQHVLAERRDHPTVFVIGSRALFRHDDLHFSELRSATQSLLAGGELIAANRDATYPMPDGLWPGTGAVVAALEYATGRRARIVGKPEPQLFLTALDRLGPGKALVIGDSIASDLQGAAATGLDAAIVLTGGTSRTEAEEASDPAPVAIADDLYSLVTGS